MEYSEVQKNEMREKLKKVAQKKITTTMIFALDQFEQYFGKVFGHKVEESQLTDSQKQWGDYWEKCRENILNNGNKQARGLMSEIDGHDVSLKRYVTKIINTRNI